MHLFLDGFDGVVARASKATKLGEYLDLITDRTITVLILIKTSILLQNQISFIVTALFIFSVLIFFISKLRAPIIFIRLVVLISLFIFSYPTFSYLTPALTISYLIIGIISIFTLIAQLLWFLKNKHLKTS